MALPANVDTGLVTGRFLVGVIDGPDEDSEPDGVPAQGTITFTASVPYLPNPGASTTILKAPIVAKLDADGHLVSPDGAQGVRLVATDDEDLSVTGWTWTVTYTFEAVNGVRPQIASHSMALPSGAAVDLTSVVRVPSSTGIGVEQAEALAASATQAALDAADAAALAAQAAQVTDEGTAALITYGGETTAVLDTNYRRNVTPAMFGAVGDGAADDTAAINATLATGLPVHWGGAEKKYRVTSPVTVDLSGPLSWQGDGATVLGGFATPAERMVTINANGNTVHIAGLTFDAARTAFTALRIWNRFTTSPACILTDVTAQNAHRASTEHPGGDGIVVGGTWDRVALTRPTVKNITLAAGAGISGSYGVGGIYIHHISGAGGARETPHIVTITDPYVENISSEDPEHKVDQDGIKVFSGVESPGQTTPMRTHATITGGEVRNAMGRAVKSQVEMTTVDGLRIVRDEGGKGVTHDIDFQVGGGTARNIECVYINAAPSTVINFSGTRTPGRILPQKQASGVKVLIHGEVVPDRIVGVLSLDEADVSATINDVSVASDGGTVPHLVRMAGVAGAQQKVTLCNVIAHASTSAVIADGGAPGSWSGQLVALGVINTGPSVPLVTGSASASVTTSHAGVTGYTA